MECTERQLRASAGSPKSVGRLSNLIVTVDRIEATAITNEERAGELLLFLSLRKAT
jgi:hypothetical protein